jgi:WD40 repeat protein/DNA-binding MarR family transcriptional regulator
MNAHKFNEIFEKLTARRREVLLNLLRHKNDKEIADILVIDESTVRKHIQQICELFGLSNEENKHCEKRRELVDLCRKFRPELAQALCPSQNQEQLLSPKNTSQSLRDSKAQQDWGDVDGATIFYGRDQELAILKQWVTDDRCRLLTLLGTYGIGKTSLVVELAKRIQHEFEFVILRSLHNAPPIRKILADIIKFLSQQQIIELPEDLNDSINQLIELLRQHRCLLILDNIETILQPGDRTGQYIEGYQGYGKLLQRVGKANHQSCLILTSRELPQDIATQEGENLPVRLFRVNGLQPENAEEIIKYKGLSGTKNNLKKLVELYECHPLSLELITPTIKTVHNGDIGKFLELPGLLKIRDRLEWYFERLSHLETQVMYWLAINRDFVSITELQADIEQLIRLEDLIYSLESLINRSLISRNIQGFKQQPYIMEYITEQLIKQICEEIKTGQIQIFKSHAIIKATAKDYVRETQIKLILLPIINDLLNTYGCKSEVENKLKHLLLQIKKQKNIGYSAGNIVNLLVALQVDFTNHDFSEITIQQAYLRNVNLYNVNFQNTHIYNTVFTETIASIFAIAFSPDGKTLAISDYRGTIQLLDSKTREKILIINETIGYVVRGLVFSRDGKILASGSTNETIQLWDVTTGECLKTLQGHNYWINSLAFNPDGQILASASSDYTIKIWDINTGRCLQTFAEHTDSVNSVAFNSQGILASGSKDKTIKLWDIKNNKCIMTFTGHQESVNTIAFSPDGVIMASGSADSTIKLWDMKNHQCLKTLQAHKNAVLTVAFSADNQILASGGCDNKIQLWNIQDRENIKIINTLSENHNWIRAIAFNPKNNILASGDADSTAKLWNLQDINNIHSLITWQGYTNEVRTVAFHPQGTILASGSSDKLVRLWDINSGQTLAIFQGHTDIVYSVAFSPDGTILASGSGDNKIKFWNINTSKCYKTLWEHENHVRCVAFNYQNQSFASGSRDCTVKQWDIEQGKSTIILQEYPERVNCIAFHPHQDILACGIYNGDVKLWNLSNRKYITTLSGHSKRINAVAFSPQRDILASASSDNTIIIWDMKTYQKIATLKGHTNWVRSVIFHPQENILASSSNDNTVRLWDIQTSETIAILDEHSHWVHSVDFSPCGTMLASGSADETIKLWDIKTATCWRTLTIPKPYQGMNITGVTGINEETKLTLKALGAVEFL